MLSIGELSRATGVTARAIRHYEQIGLLTSQSKGNVRCFLEETEVELRVIADLRDLGFSLDEIGVLLGLELRQSADFKPKISLADRPKLLARLAGLNEKVRRISRYIGRRRR